MKSTIAASALAFLIAGCTGQNIGLTGLPKTLGETSSNYGYVPIDPLAVETVGGGSCSMPEPSKDDYKDLLEALPDLTVRFAVASFNANGGFAFGPTEISAKGERYRAVLDYINVDTVSVPFKVSKRISGNNGPFDAAVTYTLDEKKGEKVVAYEAQVLSSIEQQNSSPLSLQDALSRGDFGEEFSVVTIPVYVGVGLRLTADLFALETGAELTGLSAIGIEASAKKLSGTLSVQTLGVTGSRVATGLPLPSKLDTTTIENSLVSLGSARTLLYTSPDGKDPGATTTARVVGIYSPIGTDPALINALYSALSERRPIWRRPCK